MSKIVTEEQILSANQAIEEATKMYGKAADMAKSGEINAYEDAFPEIMRKIADAIQVYLQLIIVELNVANFSNSNHNESISIDSLWPKVKPILIALPGIESMIRSFRIPEEQQNDRITKIIRFNKSKAFYGYTKEEISDEHLRTKIENSLGMISFLRETVREIRKSKFQSLLNTNPYLSDPKLRAKMIHTSVVTSTAIEGVHVKTPKSSKRTGLHKGK